MGWNEENEIQVLGTPVSKHGNKRFLCLGMFVLCVALLVGGVVWFVCGLDEDIQEAEMQEIEQPAVVPVSFLPDSASSLLFSVDSINDVKMRIYTLNGLTAGLSFDLPDKSDTTVFLVIPAADVRRDNGGIVGDFLLHGKQLARGKRKKGYCAVLDGEVMLGLAIDDEMLEYCMRQRGDFFRQYPLVINGEIQENRLKGKALRRALARQGGNLFFVESCNRESVYDFAEALADYGFSEALYLVGGNSYGWWRKNTHTVCEIGELATDALSLNLNYLIFRNSGSH